MTVKQLIEELNEIDETLTVYIKSYQDKDAWLPSYYEAERVHAKKLDPDFEKEFVLIIDNGK